MSAEERFLKTRARLIGDMLKRWPLPLSFMMETPLRLRVRIRSEAHLHRNLVLSDERLNWAKYCPLHEMESAKASFAIHNSVLSEEAVLGFEYGYSVFRKKRSYSGKRSLAISPTAHRCYSTNSSHQEKRNGGKNQVLSSYCRMALKGRDRSIPVRGWNDSCNYVQKVI